MARGLPFSETGQQQVCTVELPIIILPASNRFQCEQDVFGQLEIAFPACPFEYREDLFMQRARRNSHLVGPQREVQRSLRTYSS